MSIILNRATRALGLSLCAALIVLAAACKMTMVDQGALNRVKDTTAPILLIASPSDGFACANIVEVRGSVSDSINSGEKGLISNLAWEIPGTSIKGNSVEVKADGSYIIQFDTSRLGTSFFFNISATDWNGNVATKTLSLVKDAGSSIPTFTAVPSNKSINLTWTSVPNTSSYTLYYTTDGSLPSDLNGTRVSLLVSAKSYALTNCVNGNAYCFRLKALPQPGWSESRSDYIKIIPLSARSLCPNVEGGYDQLKVGWNAIPSTDSFEIWRRKGDNGEFSLFAQVTGTSYVDRSVEAGQWYYYKVKPVLYCPILSEAEGATILPFLQRPAIVDELPNGNSGSVLEVVVAGPWLYVSTCMWSNPGRGKFSIYDLSDPANPVLAKSLALDAQNIVIAGNRAFVTCFAASGSEIGRLAVIDITNPQNASILANVPLQDLYPDGSVQPQDLAESEGRVYVAAASGGNYYGDEIQIYDIAADGTPSYAGYLPMPKDFNGNKDSSMCLRVKGAYAYVGCFHSGMITIELSNKSVVSAIPNITADDDWPSSIEIDGDSLLLADGNAGLRVYDLKSDPSHPVLRQRIDTPGWANDISTQGGFGFVADSSSGLQIIDITPLKDGTPSLAHLPLPGVYGTPLGFRECSVLSKMATTIPEAANRVAAYGSWAYVGTRSGVEVVNIDSPSSAVLEKTLDISGYIADMVLQGQRGYILHDNSLSVMDLEDPANPRIHTALAISGLNLGSIARSGAWLFGVSSTAISAIDISDPDRPLLAANVSTGLSINGGLGSIAVSGQWLYMPNGNYGLSIFDISDPLHPELAAQVNTGQGSGVALSGSYAYVSCSSGLAIVDVSYPRKAGLIKTVGSSFDSYSAKSVSVSGKYAYIADQRIGVQIFDISDPQNASLVRSIEPYRDASDNSSVNLWPSYSSVNLQGSWAFAPTIVGELSIINIIDPAHAVLASRLFQRRSDLNGSQNKILVGGGFAYLSDRANSSSSSQIKVLRLIP